MGQELGYISSNDVLTLTTDDESIPIADLDTLLRQSKDVRQLKVVNVSEHLLKISQLKPLGSIAGVKFINSSVAVKMRELAALFPSLQVLQIHNCRNIDYSSLDSFTQLSSLDINTSGFAGSILRFLPKSLKQLALANTQDISAQEFEPSIANLSELHLVRCQVHALNKLLNLINNSALRKISLESIQQIPQTLELSTPSLECLKVQECPVEQLVIKSHALKQLELRWCYCLSAVQSDIANLREIILDNTNCQIKNIESAPNTLKVTIFGGNDNLRDFANCAKCDITVDRETMDQALRLGISAQRLRTTSQQ